MCVARRIFGISFAIAALALFAHPALAAPRASAPAFSPLGPETSIPFGWVDFCQRYAGECDDAADEPAEIEGTPAAFRKIEAVNRQTNRRVEPVSDTEHAGTPESWDYPEDGKGDCEDYALSKRRQLMQAGFPRSALLIAIVKDEHGDGHSVLMVRTSRGDYVLDNLTDEVKPWSKTAYRFVKRQSQENPNVWVAIGAPTSAPMYVAK